MKILSRVVVFPDEYSIIHQFKNKSIKLLGSFYSNKLEEVCDEKKDFKCIGVDFGGFRYFLALKGFCVFEKPIKSKSAKFKSSKSDALYIAESKDRKEGLLLQYLPIMGKTSKHCHKGKDEAFHLIEGQVEIVTPRKNFYFAEKNTEIIKKGVIHQLCARKSPALILLEIVGDPKGLSMDDHTYA